MITLRLIALSILLCGIGYTAIIHGFAKLTNSEQANGSLIRGANGNIVGSGFIAQAFTSERYFHPRPSACDYNAAAAAGSNLSPLHPKLRTRAEGIIAAHQANEQRRIPADLVTASGSGLDPDITEAAARFQAERVAKARQMDPAKMISLIDQIKRPLMGTFSGPMLVNVLELNLALDQLHP